MKTTKSKKNMQKIGKLLLYFYQNTNISSDIYWQCKADTWKVIKTFKAAMSNTAAVTGNNKLWKLSKSDKTFNSFFHWEINFNKKIK